MKLHLSHLFAACVCGTSFAAAQSNASIAKQILPLLHQQEVAANAHDTDAFLASFDHDSSLVFIVNGEVIQGFAALHEQQLKWWKNGKSDVVYTEQTKPQVMVLDSHAALVTQQLASHRTMPDGTTHDDTFVITSIWKKLSAGWRVTYCHESHVS